MSENTFSEPVIAAPLRLEAFLISSGAPALRVTRVGMGPARAARSARALLEDPARALIVMGVCGGLASTDRPGEVILANEVRVLTADGDLQEPISCSIPPPLTASLSESGLRVRHGSIASATQIVHGHARARLNRLGADAVDMESAWLAPGARGRPFVVIRVVADTPTHDLRRPDLLLASWSQAALMLRRSAKALGALLERPGAGGLFPGGEQSV